MNKRSISLAVALVLAAVLFGGCVSRPVAYSKTQWAAMTEEQKQRAMQKLDGQFAGHHAGFEQSVLYLGYPSSLGDYVYQGN